MRKKVGGLVLTVLVIYLFIRGALVMRPKEMVGALSTLIAFLVNACSGLPQGDTSPASPQHRTALEERRERDPVGNCQGHEGRESNVDPGVLDHAQVLGVEPGKFCGLLLSKLSFFPNLAEPQAETLCGPFDRLPEGRPQPHF